MLYALLAYHDEERISGWSSEEEAAVLERLHAVRNKWGPAFRPVLRLHGTRQARTLRSATRTVTDGPFAETAEQLLGLYIIEVDDASTAEAIARELNLANPTASYEIRPVRTLLPDAATP